MGPIPTHTAEVGSSRPIKGKLHVVRTSMGRGCHFRKGDIRAEGAPGGEVRRRCLAVIVNILAAGQRCIGFSRGDGKSQGRGVRWRTLGGGWRKGEGVGEGIGGPDHAAGELARGLAKGDEGAVVCGQHGGNRIDRPDRHRVVPVIGDLVIERRRGIGSSGPPPELRD